MCTLIAITYFLAVYPESLLISEASHMNTDLYNLLAFIVAPDFTQIIFLPEVPLVFVTSSLNFLRNFHNPSHFCYPLGVYWLWVVLLWAVAHLTVRAEIPFHHVWEKTLFLLITKR
jgi:hypothetical protein